MNAPPPGSPSFDGRTPLERLLLRLFPAAVVGLDAAGRIRLWNARAEAYFGERAEQVVGRTPCWTEMPQIEGPRAATGPAPTVPLRGDWLEVRTAAGKTRSLLRESFPTDEADGGELRLYWTPEDLDASPVDGIRQQLLDFSGAMLFVKDVGLRNIAVNRPLAEIGGLFPQDLLGKTLREVLLHQQAAAEASGGTRPAWTATPETAAARAEEHERWDRRVLATGEGVEYEVVEYEARRPRTFVVRKEPLRDGTRRIWGVLAHSREVTAVRQAQAALEASERRQRRLLENSLEAITLYDETGAMIFHSPNTERILGRLPVSIMSADGAQVLLPGEQERLRGLLHRLKTEPDRPIFGERISVSRPDGGRRMLEFNLRNMLHDPDVGAIVANWRDISARHEAEIELRRREERLRLALDGGQLGLFESDPARDLVWISPELSEMMGFAKEVMEVPWSTIHGWIHPEDLPWVRQRNDPPPPPGHLTVEHRIIRPNGEVRWVHSVYRNRPDAPPGTVVGVVQDITDRMRAVLALRQSEERFRLASRATNDTIREYDPATGIMILAGNTAPFVDSPEEPVGRDWWIERLHPEDREATLARLEAALADGLHTTLEYRIRSRDGHYIHAADHVCIVRDDSGKPRKLVGALTDVTALRQAEATLRSNLRLLKEVTAAQGGYIAGISPFRQFTQLVEAFCRLTDSPHGFLGEVMTDEEGAPFLAVHAITDMAWNDESRAILAGLEQRPADFRRLRNLFGEVVLGGRPVISNDPQHDPRSGGTPEGHRKLQSFLGAPCHLDDRMVGMIGLADRPGGYTDEMVEFLQPLLSTTALIIAAVRNKAERDQAETALRESEARLRQLMEGLDNVIWLMSRDGTYLYLSPSYERLWGRPVALLDGRHEDWVEAVLPEDRERVRNRIRRRFESGEYFEEYRIRRPDGGIRWIRDRGCPIHDEHGNLYRFAGIAEDITHWKELQERLREQAAMLDKARSAILVTDLAGRVEYANEFAERLYGWSLAEMRGLPIVQFMEVPETEDTPEIRGSLADRDEWQGESVKRTRGGPAVIVEESRTLVRNEAGIPKSILRIHADVTERRQMQTQALRRQRLESLGTLAGGIAHDLNNALTPTRLALGLIEETTDKERRRHLLQQAQGGIERSASMVRRILEFARGRETPRQPLRLEGPLEELERILDSTLPKSLRVTFDVRGPLRRIQADATQISQVLMNVCLNARDAMEEEGLLTVRAENAHLDDRTARRRLLPRGGEFVQIRIDDTGTGMSKEVLERIFDPFFTTKEPGKGAGLGLSMSQTIVRQHGGFIDIDSRPGLGTSFRLWFPACEEAEIPRLEDRSELPQGGGATILLIDDEPNIRDVAVLILSRVGYQAVAAADGVEGLAQFVRHRSRIAAVVVDLMMPVMDGPAVIQALRSISPQLPILAVSGQASAKILETKGITDVAFLPKPYTKEQLIRALGRLLTPGEGEKAPEQPTTATAPRSPGDPG